MDLEAAQMDPGGAEVPKLVAQIHQVGVQNPPSWGPKSRKIGLGRPLGESWGHLGPKTRPGPKNTPKPNFWGPSWGGVLEAKIGPKSIF